MRTYQDILESLKDAGGTLKYVALVERKRALNQRKQSFKLWTLERGELGRL